MMTGRQALASALHLFVLLSFFAGGLLFVCLPFMPEVREKLVFLFLYEMEICTLIGVGFLMTSLLLMIGFFVLNRGRYLRIRMGAETHRAVEINVRLIRQTLEECFKSHFPDTISLLDVEVPQGAQIEVGVKLSSMDDQAREELLARAEKHLQVLFKDRFGYDKPFILKI
jgi:hypothetical protein